MRNLRKVVILFVAIGVLLFSYTSNQKRLIRDFTDTALSTRVQINQYAKISSDFIELMGVYGTEYFKNSTEGTSPYYSALTYDPSRNGFSLDKAEERGYEGSVGNLTGKGNIPVTGENLKEIALGLNYNAYFDAFYKTLEGVAWIYYTSESGFVNLYPWVPSKQVKYTDEMLKNEYMRVGRITRNSENRSYWSKIYMDLAGKGQMITVSKGIFHGAVFKGVVSLDFTLDQLNKLLPEGYKVYLISENEEVLATNDNSKRLEKKTYTLDTIFEDFKPADVERLRSLPEKEVIAFHSEYVYLLNLNDVPWKLYFILPNSIILVGVVSACIPVLLTVILLFYITSEADARKKAEKELADTVEALKDYQEKLEKTATLDFLTGALNRRGGLKRIEEESAIYERKERPFSFVLLDIDHFKYFNDRYGHRAGDMVLVKSCEVLRKNIRGSDIICRWGGEEFLIVLFDTTFNQAMGTAEKLREEIEKTKFPWEGGTLSITMTFGVLEYDKEVGIEMSISGADHAMYEGKNQGRNKVIGYTKSQYLNTYFESPVI